MPRIMNKLFVIIFVYIHLYLFTLTNGYCGACGPEGNGDCDDQPWAVLKGGLYWAWASPCSGDCSQIIDSPIPYGWRRATDDEFYNIEPPTPAEFGSCGVNGVAGCHDRDSCAAYVFDPTHDHCDGNDAVRSGFVHVDVIGQVLETILVRDVNPCDMDYYLVENTGNLDFADANEYCSAIYGTQLATINNQDDVNKAEAVIDDTDFPDNGGALIGLHDEDFNTDSLCFKHIGGFPCDASESAACAISDIWINCDVNREDCVLFYPYNNGWDKKGINNNQDCDDDADYFLCDGMNYGVGPDSNPAAHQYNEGIDASQRYRESPQQQPYVIDPNTTVNNYSFYQYMGLNALISVVASFAVLATLLSCYWCYKQSNDKKKYSKVDDENI